MMQQTLLAELELLIADLKQKEKSIVYTIPDEIMGAVKRAKHLERFLLDVLDAVIGSGGISITSIIRREFGMSKDLTDHIDRWAPYSKEQFEDELHEAIDRADIRAGKQGLFFEGTVSKKESVEALGLLKDIAHAAVRCQFNPRFTGPEAYVDLLDKLIQYYALPHTHPAGSPVKYRSLISSGRLYAMSGNMDTIAAALKAHVKQWYQMSSFTFLEDREWYPSYEYVQEYSYALTGEQLERLRDDFIRLIGDEFAVLKSKPELHKAEYLRKMLETVLNWKAG